MASISFRTAAKTAAVAGALGLAASFGAPAATAQEPAAQEGLNLGSLFTILDLTAMEGSVTGSLNGEGADTGSVGSVAGFLNEGSLNMGVINAQGSTSTSGSAGSVGDAAGVIDESTFGGVVAGSLGTMSSDTAGTNSLAPAEGAEGSVGNFFGALRDVKDAQTTTP